MTEYVKAKARIKTIKGELWFVCPFDGRKLARLEDCATANKVYPKCTACKREIELATE